MHSGPEPGLISLLLANINFPEWIVVVDFPISPQNSYVPLVSNKLDLWSYLNAALSLFYRPLALLLFYYYKDFYRPPPDGGEWY